MVTLEEYERASARGRRAEEETPRAVEASYDRKRRRIVVELANGIGFMFSPEGAQGLEGAKASDLAKVEISAAGRGLHFPTLDADLYIPALLEGILGSARWTAARLGQAGGSAKSDAKAKASRQNGKLGGRPRKSRPSSS